MNHMEDLSVKLAHLHGTAEERWNEEISCPLCSILTLYTRECINAIFRVTTIMLRLCNKFTAKLLENKASYK